MLCHWKHEILVVTLNELHAINKQGNMKWLAAQHHLRRSHVSDKNMVTMGDLPLTWSWNWQCLLGNRQFICSLTYSWAVIDAEWCVYSWWASSEMRGRQERLWGVSKGWVTYATLPLLPTTNPPIIFTTPLPPPLPPLPENRGWRARRGQRNSTKGLLVFVLEYFVVVVTVQEKKG